MKERFNIKHKLVEKFEHPYIYFTDAVINDRTIDLRAVEQALAAEFQKFKDVTFAVSSRALASVKRCKGRALRLASLSSGGYFCNVSGRLERPPEMRPTALILLYLALRRSIQTPIPGTDLLG
jgi:hypothetical protein